MAEFQTYHCRVLQFREMEACSETLNAMQIWGARCLECTSIAIDMHQNCHDWCDHLASEICVHILACVMC